jgi:hypothetical protein
VVALFQGVGRVYSADPIPTAMLSLDHAIIFVRDLALAAASYRRLGFCLTPRGVHPALGTANHTIMFERTYLELLTIVETNPKNSRWAAILERRDGLGGAALGTREASAAKASLEDRGIAVPALVDFGRPVALPDGVVEARFTVAHLPDDATPVLPAFFCQHHTRGLVWRSEFERHSNTAFHLAGLTIVHADPLSVAGAYQRLLGRASVHPHPGGIALDLRGTRAWIVTPGFAEARLHRPVPDPGPRGLPVGLTILVRDLGSTRRVLADNGVPFAPFGHRSVAVEEDRTHGVHLEFLGV